MLNVCNTCILNTWLALMHANPMPDRQYLSVVPIEPFASLTDRESEVLHLLAGGATNANIARALGLAEGTVRNVVARITVKLGVADRTQAALLAFHAAWGIRYRLSSSHGVSDC
jgi:DNA-binding NarL/FixJ family response regulator